MRRAALLTLIALWAVAASVVSAPVMAGDFAFKCRISAPAKIQAGKKIPLTFTLTNKGSGAVNVLTWNTPLEGLTGTFMRVSAPDGTELAYGGPMVKRAPPTAENYLRIRKGSTRERTIDLARAYSFTKPGVYRVAFTGSLADVYAGAINKARSFEQLVPLSVACPEIKLDLQR